MACSSNILDHIFLHDQAFSDMLLEDAPGDRGHFSIGDLRMIRLDHLDDRLQRAQADAADLLQLDAARLFLAINCFNASKFRRPGGDPATRQTDVDLEAVFLRVFVLLLERFCFCFFQIFHRTDAVHKHLFM